MNVFTAVGRVTADAEQRYTAGGDAVLGFTVASDVGYGDKKHALFIKCSMWGKRGEALAPHVTKGTPVTVSGELDLRTWEKDGKAGTSLELKVAEVALQGGKPTEDKPKAAGFRKPEPQPDFIDDDTPF
jgi:single-strand DNA-binding protein